MPSKIQTTKAATVPIDAADAWNKTVNFLANTLNK
jgi:hypothetical protein